MKVTSFSDSFFLKQSEYLIFDDNSVVMNPAVSNSPLPDNLTNSEFSINTDLLKSTTAPTAPPLSIPNSNEDPNIPEDDSYPSLPGTPDGIETISGPKSESPGWAKMSTESPNWGGVKGLAEDLNSRTPHMAPHGFLPPIDQAGSSGRNFQDIDGMEELLETLECPVCLDTADTPPIYQCPEGHLVCQVRGAACGISSSKLVYRIAMPRW